MLKIEYTEISLISCKFSWFCELVKLEI